ncbi:lipoprotein signal peptidase [Legionella jordanis]|uniref:Lipoprotein signal peptidase n=1 Tax=Legionella jordanis TaxID=456 RepID=A0A0W0VBI0_9GAMM|nr:signal peptidase II [Legionella jordanis]KTD17455.1 lipoprotein signal peptidase [Legionella jordanis]VEH13424.1 signal peptidase II [Legionella jordanis]
MLCNKKQLYWLWLSVFAVLLDQYAKYLTASHLYYGESIQIFPIFNLTLTFNKGAAWGFLNNAGGWQVSLFAMIAIIFSIAIVVWIYRLPMEKHWQACSLSLILGGAISNLIDRFAHGHVIDFIQIHYHHWYFPNFNIADSVITIGATMSLILLNLNRESNER